MQLSDKQKDIYNAYLCALGIVNDRGYKKKQNFDNIKDDDAVSLIKLEQFFSLYKHIIPLYYFRTILKYLKNKDNINNIFYPLNFFIKQKAISIYSKACKNEYNEYIDSDESCKDFINSFIFIYNFCKTYNKSIEEYKTLYNNFDVPYFFIHLKEHKISLYHLFALDINLLTVNKDVLDMTMPQYEEILIKAKQSYYSSKKLKTAAETLRTKLK